LDSAGELRKQYEADSYRQQAALMESPRIDVVPDHLNSCMDEVTPGKDDTTFALDGWKIHAE
jgi:hypothetical protein